MGARRTQDQFIIGCIEKHGETYLYDKAVYQGCKSKIVVTCKTHGDFELEADSHIRGTGCAECGTERMANANRGNLSEFLDKMKTIHGDTYDFSEIKEYKNSYTKLPVKCHKHGIFYATRGHLINGNGCAECGMARQVLAQSYTTDIFTDAAIEVHGTNYTYSKVAYQKSNKKVTITCPTHGDFEQTPANHLHGQGCNECQNNGYCKTKPGTFYILTCENYVKVGITNRKVKDRSRKIIKTSGINFTEYASFYFQDGSIALAIETEILKHLRATYTPVDQKFDGSTECFTDVDVDKLINFVSPLTSES